MQHDRADFLAAFSKRHSINATALTRVGAPLHWTSQAVTFLDDVYVKNADRLLHDPTSGLLLNMIHRAFEQMEGSLVAFVTGCGASSELVARAALELSASILYILAKDRMNRLIAYFNDYLEGVEKQIRKWSALTNNMPAPARDVHILSIQNRQRANDALRTIVERMKKDFGVNPESWPTAFERFEQIDKASTYRTVYARLCSQTHSDAEETLRYFLAVSVGDQKMIERMGIETWEFTRLMVFIASSFFISVVGKYAEIFGMADLASPVENAHRELDQEMKSIIFNIGAF